MTWYLYEDNQSDYRWWSDWPPCYMRKYKLIRQEWAKYRPTVAQ